jgi:hypothetical protein
VGGGGGEKGEEEEKRDSELMNTLKSLLLKM